MLEQEQQLSTRWEGYVDWRNRAAIRGRHGGMLAASFVLVAEILENLAYLANASNLVLYLSEYMHLSPSKAANNVTDFMGTAFLLALLGGFLSDAFFTTYHIYLISTVIEFLGLIILTVQARLPSLKPPTCSPDSLNNPCQEVEGGKAALLFIGLYLVALGVGGIKGSLPSHGAEQFDESTHKEGSRDQPSSTTTNKIPCGSPLTTIFKVLIAATLHSCMTKSPSNAIANMAPTPSSPTPTSKEIQEGNATEKEASTADDQDQAPTQSLKFLNRAVQVNNPAHKALECTLQQVEEVKIVLKILPIFACTIMLNCCLAQLSTFSVQQAATMDTKLGSLKVPPASLPIFPVVFIMILAPVYDFFIIPFARKSTKSEMGITHLQRIGIGLALSIIAMAIAALVEIKRKRVASNSGLLDSKEPLPLTFFWIALQYLFLGSADLFTLAGLLEFFFTEAPTSMRSLATSLTWASLAMGYYLSSVIVSVVNDVSGKYSKHKWLSGSNLNHYHLERFYWLMCVLSGLNFLHYLFWAIRYKYRPGRPNK
ncbi:protein NRT1/ PTR FAMILY 4.6 [Prunus yedoensis var. nudiflora]|uniref:Protein NRT1/ PTR FAMILY 4.6 n=1 Tax=Prunus yedoensis var. nudiflora TaxID=2094558 RepID=A0A314UJA3_PRUYE|nr:protein NRT1/ PTR FAMILY 4.6 [Prunus yedoensis var. nudiflora]